MIESPSSKFQIEKDLREENKNKNNRNPPFFK